MKNRIFTLLGCLVAFVGAAMAQTYKEFTKTTIFYTTLADAKAAFAEGWMSDGKGADTYSEKSKQDIHIDPETDEAPASSTKLAGVVIKQKNKEKSVVFYVKGVSEVKTYTRNTGSDDRTLNIEITPNGGETSTVTAVNTMNISLMASTGALNPSQEYKIVLWASGDLMLYALKFMTPEGPSSDASIAKVELGGNEVAYNEDSYYATIPATYTKEIITLKVTPTDAKAVVTVDLDDTPNTTPGEYATDLLVDDLGDGATITVTAEDGTTTYSVNLFADKATEADTDNSLAKVTVDGEELTADDSGTNYPYAIPFDYSGELTVAAEATSQYATVLILDTDNNPTVAGGQSAVVPVKVMAESGDIANYTVTITREAASTACDLTAFSINGFKGVIDGTNVTVKTVEGYDFSHTPVMSISEKAVAAWDAAAKTVVVTAQDGTTAQTYTVAAAAEYVQPYTVTEAAHISLAAADAPEGYEWIYGPNYNPTMADFTSVAVGGYDLAKASDAANVAAGKNILKVYVANCDMLTFNLGATGTRKVNVTMGETALVTGFPIAEKNTMYAVTCEVNSREAVVLELESFTKDGAPTNGGTRIFSIDVTPMADDPTSISDAKAAGMAIYAADGQVLISTAEAALIDIYAIDGRLVRRVELAEGTNAISGLARGMYLINNQKVIVK